MASRATAPKEQPKIIIVKKVVGDDHGGHHGGAWKVAYADFVTAMMAFFLLLWLLGATNEKQRKALADYFAPTLVEFKQGSAGADGLLGGSSLIDADDYPHKAQQTGNKSITVPVGAVGGPQAGSGDDGALSQDRKALADEDRKNFQQLRSRLAKRLENSARLNRLRKNVRFVPTREGVRIDLIDDADFSMFASGTTALEPPAAALIREIAGMVAPMPNQLAIRGHTDAVPYGDPTVMNNWMLSTGRSEATRRALQIGGVGESRFDRIEGVAEREPFIAGNPLDPRNRRVSITLLYRRAR